MNSSFWLEILHTCDVCWLELLHTCHDSCNDFRWFAVNDLTMRQQKCLARQKLDTNQLYIKSEWIKTISIWYEIQKWYQEATMPAKVLTKNPKLDILLTYCIFLFKFKYVHFDSSKFKPPVFWLVNLSMNSKT